MYSIDKVKENKEKLLETRMMKYIKFTVYINQPELQLLYYSVPGCLGSTSGIRQSDNIPTVAQGLLPVPEPWIQVRTNLQGAVQAQGGRPRQGSQEARDPAEER